MDLLSVGPDAARIEAGTAYDGHTPTALEASSQGDHGIVLDAYPPGDAHSLDGRGQESKIHGQVGSGQAKETQVHRRRRAGLSQSLLGGSSDLGQGRLQPGHLVVARPTLAKPQDMAVFVGDQSEGLGCASIYAQNETHVLPSNCDR